MAVANGVDPKFKGVVSSATEQDVIAGGASLLSLGSSGFVISAGSGAPTFTAPKGSVYLRSDGSTTATRMYINSTGTGGWVAVTTAS